MFKIGDKVLDNGWGGGRKATIIDIYETREGSQPFCGIRYDDEADDFWLQNPRHRVPSSLKRIESPEELICEDWS